MRLALQKHVLVGPPAPQQLQAVAPATGLDERVVGLVIGLVVAGCVGLIAASQGIVSTVSAEPARVATLLAITRGFRDALKIGTQERPDIFARKIVLPEPLYAGVIEIDEGHLLGAGQ